MAESAYKERKEALKKPPKKPTFQSPVEEALGKDVGKSTATKETSAERLARIRKEREKTQAGENPTNPMPTEDPGPGMYWANFGGTWRKYAYTTDTGGGGGGGDGGGGDGGGGGGGGGGGKTVVSTYTDPTTGDVYAIYSDSSREVISQGNKALEAAKEEARIAEEKRRQGQSAYDLLYSEFDEYGMGGLVEPLKQFIQEGLSSSEFTLRLRGTDAYKKRFAANAVRIQKGLSALNEAEYIGLEDQYQNIMRNYELPASYYTRGDMGRQEGFEKFIGSDVSATELEDRIMTAQSRVLNTNPEVLASLKQFYPEITNGDILAYTLDPTKALNEIKRKVTAAEIGGAARQAGLNLGQKPEEIAAYAARAGELGAAGITKAQAAAGYGEIAQFAPRGGQLAQMYGETPYTQATAETELFGLTGKAEAEKQRKKLVGLEKASFSKQTGAAQGALGRERAGGI